VFLKKLIFLILLKFNIFLYIFDHALETSKHTFRVRSSPPSHRALDSMDMVSPIKKKKLIIKRSQPSEMDLASPSEKNKIKMASLLKQQLSKK